MPLPIRLHFAAKTWVLWHDNFGSTPQKVGWIVRGVSGNEALSVSEDEKRNYDLKFLPPHSTPADGEEHYHVAMPNPAGLPFLFRPQTNRILPIPRTKQEYEAPETVDANGAAIEIRSNGRAADTLVTIGGKPVGMITKAVLTISADSPITKLQLETIAPDLTLLGRVISIEAYDPLKP